MVKHRRPSGQTISDLFSDSMAAAYPDRFGSYTDDPNGYRMPLDQLFGSLDGQDSNSGFGLINWSAALKAAFEDGYDPLMPIGDGATSSVWRCIDRSFGREVALKFIRDNSTVNAERAEQVLHEEAEMLGRLQHPGIVQAVRRSGAGYGSYLAIDFVDGDNLLTHARLLALDAKSRIRLFARALDAVSYLHKKGVVHGDLKPEHILIREHSQPVLIDFGLSSGGALSELGISGTKQVGGSGHYRAPEVVSGTAAEPTTCQDIYSLGILLEELIKGVNLGDARACVQRALEAASSENPQNRPQDAHELLEILQPALTTGLFESPKARSHRLMRWVLLACLVAVIGIQSGIWLIPRSDEPDNVMARRGDGTDRLIAQASLFDLTLQDIYAGNNKRAVDRLGEIEDERKETDAPWEERHLQSMVKGQGESRPFGETPYDAKNVLSVDYDRATDTIAYVVFREGKCQLWVRSLQQSPRLIYVSSDYIFGVALGKGAERVAVTKENGECVVWMLNAKNLEPIQKYVIPLENHRVAWFGNNGQSLYLQSSNSRTLECWSIGKKQPMAPAFVIHDSDHAYRLGSGEGSNMVATKGERTESGKTLLRVINAKGQTTRTLELADGQLPISADAGPGKDSTVALGMPGGYVRIHKAEQGGWLAPSDLGTSNAVASVLICEPEGRVFAALGRVHIIDMKGNVRMRLGKRDDREHLITRFEFDRDSATLTSVSVQEVWRCIGK